MTLPFVSVVLVLCPYFGSYVASEVNPKLSVTRAMCVSTSGSYW
jgi:hypothetical protein